MKIRVISILTAVLLLSVSGGTSSLGPTALVAEPEVTCGWCHEYEWSSGQWTHGFNDVNGDLCGSPNPFSGLPGNVYCARCGGTSSCHITFGESGGRCHLACGGSALAPFERKLQDLIDSGDARILVAQLRQIEGEYGALTEFIGSAGRLDILASCNLSVAALTFSVPERLRAELQVQLASTKSWVTDGADLE